MGLIYFTYPHWQNDLSRCRTLGERGFEDVRKKKNKNRLRSGLVKSSEVPSPRLNGRSRLQFLNTWCAARWVSGQRRWTLSPDSHSTLTRSSARIWHRPHMRGPSFQLNFLLKTVPRVTSSDAPIDWPARVYCWLVQLKYEPGATWLEDFWLRG